MSEDDGWDADDTSLHEHMLKEMEEQARLLGMSASREADHLAMIERQNKEIADYQKLLRECKAENKRLRKACEIIGGKRHEQTCKDAERYRWLLNQGYTYSNGFFALEFYAGLDDIYESKSFNEAIDEAMKDEQ